MLPALTQVLCSRVFFLLYQSSKFLLTISCYILLECVNETGQGGREGEREGIPCSGMDYKGRAPPERSALFRVEVCKRIAISRLHVGV